MLTLLAALAMAPVATAATDSQLQAAPWWERITVTVSGDGQSQGCLYTSSSGASSSDCTVEDAASMTSSSSTEHQATGGAQLTRITFERRFTPGMVTAADVNVRPGDTLLGREVLALGIDGRGSVRTCRVVGASGQMGVDYGCAEARAEKFQASATRESAPAERQGYMTVLVYAHAEHLA